MHVGDEQRRRVEVGDGGIASDDVAGDLECVVHRGRRRETQATNRGRVAADDDDLAGVLQAVGAPVPGIERVHAVVGVAGAELEEHYRSRSMLKRDVLPEDIAEAVYFLASDMSAKSTGNMINVDAGNAHAFVR